MAEQGRKPTDEELAEREEYAHHLLALGTRKSLIKAALREKFGPLDHCTIERYLQRARTRVLLDAQAARAELRAESLAFYRALLGESFGVDVRDKIKARERVDKLLGLELKLPPVEALCEYLGITPDALADAVQRARGPVPPSADAPPPGPDLASYRLDPVGYARDVLGVEPWERQREIAEALLRPPYKVAVPASHTVGKTWTAGWLTNWWYDTRNPGVCITTAPTAREVRDLLWKEVRLQRGGRGGFKGPDAPTLWDGEDHYAKGFTASSGESFQGRHPQHLFLIFDEAIGVKPFAFRTARTMFMPTGDHAWLIIFNPTDTTSEVYAEVMSGGWHVIQMAATDHPNVQAELRGDPPPYPSAVRLSQVNDQLRDWSTPINPADVVATDIEWPPGSGKWLRPGPEAEARVLGRWPSSATYGVWSDALWHACETAALEWTPVDRPQIGCDVARHGDDWTAIHVRRGPVSLHHERGNGWDTVRTAGRLMELARQYARDEAGEQTFDGLSDEGQTTQAQTVPIVVDDTGVGGGVVDILRANGYHTAPVNAASTARREEMYPNVRSELWFHAAELAKARRLDVSQLDPDTRRRLQIQALAPVWAPDLRGRRKLEKKDDTKERCSGRSPDDMDALNLAYYGTGDGLPEVVKAKPRPATERKRDGARRLFRR